MKQLRSWFSVLYWDIYIILKDKNLSFWIFVGPVLFMLLFGFLLSGQEEQKDSHHITVRISHLSPDHPFYTHLINAGFKQDDKAENVFVFENNNPLHVKVRLKNPKERWSIQTKLWKAYLTYLVGDRKSTQRVQVFSRPWAQRFSFPTGFEYSIPAYLVMYIFFNLFGIFIRDWIEERRSNFFARILASPLRYDVYFLGKLSARFLIGFFIIGISLVMGGIFHVEWGQNIGMVGLILVFYILGSVSLGYLISFFFSDPETASGFGVIVALIFSALGGCWWPLEIVSPTMQKIGLLLPTGQMMNAFMKSFLYPHPQLQTNLVYMAIYGGGLIILTFIVAQRSMRFIREG